MKKINLIITIILVSFFVSCSSTPETIEETETNLVGTWDNTKRRSGFEFHSDGNGYTSNVDRLNWKVTEPGKFTVTMFIPSLGKREMNYQFTSMDEFKHESGSNTFKKKNSIDHVE